MSAAEPVHQTVAPSEPTRAPTASPAQPTHAPTASPPQPTQARTGPDPSVLQIMYNDFKQMVGVSVNVLVGVFTSVLLTIWAGVYFWGWWEVAKWILLSFLALCFIMLCVNILLSTVVFMCTNNIPAIGFNGLYAGWTYLAECHRENQRMKQTSIAQAGPETQQPSTTQDDPQCEIRLQSAQDTSGTQQPCAFDEIGKLKNTLRQHLGTLKQYSVQGKVWTRRDPQFHDILLLTVRIDALLEILESTHPIMEKLVAYEALESKHTIEELANARIDFIKGKIGEDSVDEGWSCRVM